MKLSISLQDDAVEFIDRYADARGVPSRSAVVQRAIELLRVTELGEAYSIAWLEWEADAGNDVWDASVGDGLKGLADASR